jgi:hypothetical protein
MCQQRPHTSVTIRETELVTLACRTCSLHQWRVTGTRSYFEVSLAVTNGSDVVATCPASVTLQLQGNSNGIESTVFKVWLAYPQ